MGSGDRSERIRTYNFPQGRVTDHRINLTLYKLDKVIAGEALDELIEALITEHQAAQLAAMEGDHLSDRRSAPRGAGCATGSAAAGSTRPELDARLLAEAVFGLDACAIWCGTSAIRSRPRRPKRLDALGDRRLSGEPVARILGEKEFYGPHVQAQRRDAGAAARDRAAGRRSRIGRWWTSRSR